MARRLRAEYGIDLATPLTLFFLAFFVAPRPPVERQ
jgi:hypothetical protein